MTAPAERAQGRDWSAYQGPQTAEAMAGLSFGYARATSWSGGSLGADPDFPADWAAMKQAGLHRGAYHYLLTTTSPDEQAAYFVATVKKHGLEPGDMLVCDSELPEPGADAATAAFCKRAGELAGPECPVLVYTNHDTGRLLTSCTGWPLWIAWPQPGATVPDPAIVAPWKGWKFWQLGTVGGVDADVYNGTSTELHGWLGSFAPKPPVKIMQWKVWGLSSLAHQAAEHHTSPQRMIELATEQGHVYGEPMKRYIARADWNAHVPAGVTLFGPEH